MSEPIIRRVVRGECLYSTFYHTEMWTLDLECGHQDVVEAGRRRDMPTTARCTQCEFESSAGRTGKDAA